jgi:mono/diheme cytochrome c family protein
MIWFAVLALAWVGAERSATGEPGDPARQPPASPHLAHAPMVRYHMQQHVRELRSVEQMLVDGHLAEAKALAFMLAKPEADPGMAPWAAEAHATAAAARGLAAARTIDEGLRYEVLVAEACAGCHLRAQQLPLFAAPPRVPPDQPTPAARMARHQWAVDRMWEGLVGADDARWRAGLDVLAMTPAPFSSRTAAPALATELQERARAARARRATETLGARTTAYGEMLVTCAACHALLGTAGAR